MSLRFDLECNEASSLVTPQKSCQQPRNFYHRLRACPLHRVERHPTVLALILLGLTLGIVRLACWRVPAISNMDEFSVLLGAETFRHLRLTNPTHPLWQSFETLHVIQIPSYASKFPPAPAALIALAETIFGNPIWGSWLADAAAVVAVFWMFAGWLPRRWAFVGGLLAATNPVLLSWGRNCLASGIGLAGAALAIGGAVRIVRHQARGNGAIMALGLALLANSRPYEGLVLACMLIGWVVLRSRPHRLFSAVAGALPVGLAVLGFMAYYNWRVTANPLELPPLRGKR